MGIQIEAVIGTEPPYKITLRLWCDLCPSFFDAETTCITGDDFIAMRAAATKAGWKETFINDRRKFICPSCAGRAPADTSAG